MKKFKEFLKESNTGEYDWTGGKPLGARVKIDKPGHEWHGKVGRIIRHVGVNVGVEVPEALGKLQFFNRGEVAKEN